MSDDQQSKTELARALAAMRRVVTAPCIVCGKPVTGAAHRRYCSDTCRVTAYRRRKRARAAGPNPNEKQEPVAEDDEEAR